MNVTWLINVILWGITSELFQDFACRRFWEHHTKSKQSDSIRCLLQLFLKSNCVCLENVASVFVRHALNLQRQLYTVEVNSVTFLHQDNKLRFYVTHLFCEKTQSGNLGLPCTTSGKTFLHLLQNFHFNYTRFDLHQRFACLAHL